MLRCEALGAEKPMDRGEGLCSWPHFRAANDDKRNFLDVMHRTVMISGGVFVFVFVFAFAFSFILLAISFQSFFFAVCIWFLFFLLYALIFCF